MFPKGPVSTMSPMNQWERARHDIVRLAHSGLDLPALDREIGRALKKVVGFEGNSLCLFTMDPSTLLFTGHINGDLDKVENRTVMFEASVNEYEQNDFNKFAQLARSRRPVATLGDAVRDRPEFSQRYRSLLDWGFERELRAALVASDSGCWGGLALFRGRGAADFDRSDVAFVEDVAPALAHGVRSALLLSTSREAKVPEAPGFILLDHAGSVEAITPTAERWLEEFIVPGRPHRGALPQPILAVASRARAVLDGQREGLGRVARARVPTRSGRWLILHGTTVEGRTQRGIAVIMEPARPPDMAALVLQANGLSAREREVTRLVMQGYSTTEIATALHISPYTVQDHLKAIFDKVGVASRRELTAKLYFDHYFEHAQNDDGLSAGQFLVKAGTASGVASS